MEGSWRDVAAWLAAMLAACALIVGASGCGDDDEPSAQETATIRTLTPERTFAPLLEVAADEPWRPMGARRFIEHSLLGIAERGGCDDRDIAVGHGLPEIQTAVTDWIYVKSLGKGPHYYRNPYDDDCELEHGTRFYTDQLTRPHDPGPRVDFLDREEGFFLDLEPEGRSGPPLGARVRVPVYADRADEGDGQVRLTYWTLYGMDGDPPVREGDWERVDVLLRDAGDDRYEPIAVQVPAGERAEPTTVTPEGRRLLDVAWDATRVAAGTHPVVEVARGSHAAQVASPDAATCADCVPWETWDSLADVRDQLWFGFGGSWGEVGASDATTGPLGPHGFWPTNYDDRM